MEQELLDKIIKLINSFNETTQFDYVTECMDLLHIDISDQDIDRYECTIPHHKTPDRKDVYTHYIIKHVESLLTEEQLTHFQESLLAHYAAFTSNDKVKEQKIAEAINKHGITDWQNSLNYTVKFLISHLNDDPFIINLLNTYQDKLDIEDQVALVIALKDNDDLKVSYIEKILDDSYILFDLISSIKDDELKLKLFEQYKEELSDGDFELEDILSTLQSDNYKVQYLINNASKGKKVSYERILYSLKSEESFLKLWDYVNIKCKVIILHNIKDPNKQYEYIKLLDKEGLNQNKKIESKDLSTIISNLPIEIIRKLIEECNNVSFDIYPVIRNSQDQELNLELLKKYGNPRKSKMVRNKQLIHSDYIIENIDIFLEIEQVPDKERIKKIILELYKINNDIVHTINWDFLQEKYINTLGLDKINIIASFPFIFEKILKFTDHQYEVFYKSLNYYINKYNDFDWNNAAHQMLAEIYFGIVDRKDITQYVTDINTVNMDNLVYILLNGDNIGIKSQEDINNYQELLLEKSNRQIKEDNLDKKRDAIFLKGFGLSDYVNLLRGFRQQVKNGIRKIYYLYSEDINLIENEELKNLFKFIKTVIECESEEKLQEIYNNITPNYLDTYKLEALLKNEYLKLYNKLLLNPYDLPKTEEGFYDAGVDFNIITTSVGAYYRAKPENYRDDWNRPSLASPHFCASFIRNDMLGTAPIKNVLYGFSSMEPNSLVLSGSNDIYSSGQIISKAENDERYYGPEKQINNSSKNKIHKYNEMDFRRIQNGQRKAPDYILVFRRDGVIDNIEEAKKASADWDNLPIVVIDINKCLESEKEKLVNLINEFYENPTKELLEQIENKIRNNQVIEPTFAKDIDLEELKKLIPSNPVFKPNALH